MKRLILVPAILLAAAVTASAQDDVPSLASFGGGAELAEWLASPEAGAPVPQGGPFERERSAFTLGARAGYLRIRDADDGTWTGGAQARLYFIKWIAVEGSLEFHQDEFMDGDVTITTYPVQATAMFFPIPDFIFRPYALGGAGWYYTRIDYSGTLSALDSETEHFFGVHVGGGAELWLGDQIVINADLRYIFIDEPGVDNSRLEDEDFDYWQFTAGLNFRL